MQEHYIFPAVFHYEKAGDISVSFPDLPGCFTCGNNDLEAVKMAQEAAGLYLCDLETSNAPIPTPTQSDKINTAPNERIFLIDVWMQKARAEIKNIYIQKTLTIPVYLDKAAQKVGLNFSQTLQEALIQKLGLN